MPNYSNIPPKDPRGFGLTLVRTPANGKLCAMLTCSDLLGCATHWFGGRTVPCEAPTCKPCEEGVPWRWHAYVSGVRNATHQHILLEFTAQAAEQLVQYRDNHISLRGCIVTAQRHRNRHNGRVILHCKPGNLDSVALPKEPNIKGALSIIWNIPLPDVMEGAVLRDMQTLRIAERKNGN